MYEVALTLDPRVDEPFAFAQAEAGKKVGNNEKFQKMRRNQKEIQEEEEKLMAKPLLDMMKKSSSGGITGL